MGSGPYYARLDSDFSSIVTIPPWISPLPIERCPARAIFLLLRDREIEDSRLRIQPQGKIRAKCPPDVHAELVKSKRFNSEFNNTFVYRVLFLHEEERGIKASDTRDV